MILFFFESHQSLIHFHPCSITCIQNKASRFKKVDHCQFTHFPSWGSTEYLNGTRGDLWLFLYTTRHRCIFIIWFLSTIIQTKQIEFKSFNRYLVKLLFLARCIRTQSLSILSTAFIRGTQVELYIDVCKQQVAGTFSSIFLCKNVQEPFFSACITVLPLSRFIFCYGWQLAGAVEGYEG